MLKAGLKMVPFFDGLSKKDLDAIARQTDEVDVPAGKVLAREGDLGHEFFIIEDGTAEVTKGGERITELGPGDFFGEIALLEEERRTATVTATSPMRLVVMTRAAFRAIDASMPHVHEQVTAAIRSRRGSAAQS